MKPLLSATQVRQAIDHLYEAMFAHLSGEELSATALIGIRTRGEMLAQRLADRLAADRKLTLDHGVLDITLYRDDLSRRKGAPLVRATEIDFDLDDRRILLIDDVLHTGRSVRAAMDALMDFGRPRKIRLGVLVDRAGRQLPIAADYIGERLDVPDNRRVQVRLAEHDGEDGVYLVQDDRTS